MRKITISVTTGFVLLIGANLYAAQGQERQERGGGGPAEIPKGAGGIRDRSPPGGDPGREMRAPRANIPDRRESVGRSVQGGDDRGQPAIEKRRVEPRPEAQSGRQGTAERQRAQERQRIVDRQRAQQQLLERRRAAEQRRALERERGGADRLKRQQAATERQRKAAQRRNQNEAQRAGERKSEGSESASVAKSHEVLRQAKTRLSVEDRRRLRNAFDTRHARLTKVKFHARIGRRIPRHVRLVPVPREVISVFPYYRDYRYVLVEDSIYIVDPRTYEIVDIVDEAYPAGARDQRAELDLTPEQRALVRDSIPPDFPEAQLRLRLALGAEIPPDVELHEFPQLVIDNIPKLRDYRFIVAQGEIVIVDPRDRSIALVIDRHP